MDGRKRAMRGKVDGWLTDFRKGKGMGRTGWEAKREMSMGHLRSVLPPLQMPSDNDFRTPSNSTVEENEFEEDKENLREAPLSPELKVDLRRVRKDHHAVSIHPEKGKTPRSPVAVRRSLSGDLTAKSSPIPDLLTVGSTGNGAL